jgi:hypothetical protein
VVGLYIGICAPRGLVRWDRGSVTTSAGLAWDFVYAVDDGFAGVAEVVYGFFDGGVWGDGVGRRRRAEIRMTKFEARMKKRSSQRWRAAE